MGGGEVAVQPGFNAQAEVVLDVWDTMVRTFHALMRQANKHVGADLSSTEWAVLAHLYRHGIEPMAKISQTVSITTGNVTYVVDKLVERGLVCRQPCKKDRRVIYAVLTEKGRQMMDELFPTYVEKIQSMLLSKLSDDELATLQLILKKLGASA